MNAFIGALQGRVEKEHQIQACYKLKDYSYENQSQRNSVSSGFFPALTDQTLDLFLAIKISIIIEPLANAKEPPSPLTGRG